MLPSVPFAYTRVWQRIATDWGHMTATKRSGCIQHLLMRDNLCPVLVVAEQTLSFHRRTNQKRGVGRSGLISNLMEWSACAVKGV